MNPKGHRDSEKKAGQIRKRNPRFQLWRSLFLIDVTLDLCS